MKLLLSFILLSLLACNANEPSTATDSTKDSVVKEHKKEPVDEPNKPPPSTKKYFNQRFRDVTVEKTGENKYRVRGEGQIFEANFGWVVEDGHNELKKGNQMTDNGAPEWGKFDFTIDVKKERENSTLTLVLFEVSAKDGSRVHELSVALP